MSIFRRITSSRPKGPEATTEARSPMERTIIDGLVVIELWPRMDAANTMKDGLGVMGSSYVELLTDIGLTDPDAAVINERISYINRLNVALSGFKQDLSPTREPARLHGVEICVVIGLMEDASAILGNQALDKHSEASRSSGRRAEEARQEAHILASRSAAIEGLATSMLSEVTST